MKTNILLKEKPKQWGLRGDPHFWNELEKSLREEDLPDTEKELMELLISRYETLLGKPITDGDTFKEEYNLGGMSTGMVCSQFWIETGFPLLIERFKNLK